MNSDELKLNLNWKKITAIILLAFLSFSFGWFIHSRFIQNDFSWKKEKEKEIRVEVLKKITEEENEKEKIRKDKEKENQEKFSNLIAKSVLIKKIDGEVVYQKNPDLILPIASLTKIMNATVALESGKKIVVLTRRALMATGDYGLLPYEIFNLKDAIEFMLIESVNDMASAISFGDHNISTNWKIFLDGMNKKARNLGMNSTLYFSENGLNINNHIMGAYSTVNDIFKLTKYFYEKYPEIAKNTVKTNIQICSNKKCHNVVNTNLILEKYPEIKFSKTGYTKKAGGSLVVVVEKNNQKYIVVILGSTKNGRFKDLERIINRL